MLQALNYGLLSLKAKTSRFLHDEKGEVNVVAIVVLIGIAIVLALLFKEQITGILESLLETIKGNAEDAVKVGE